MDTRSPGPRKRKRDDVQIAQLLSPLSGEVHVSHVQASREKIISKMVEASLSRVAEVGKPSRSAKSRRLR